MGPAFDADTLPQSLQRTLARAVGLETFPELREKLVETSNEVYALFQEIVEEPAKVLAAAKDP